MSTGNQHEQLAQQDPFIAEKIQKEYLRQKNNLELIASENYVSAGVLQAMGSVLTNKYAEGYPHKRYYSGCEWVDQIEQEAIKRACQLFQADFANVQAHSGSQANMAVYSAFLNPGDSIMGMNLSDGGHLTHGSTVNFSGQCYQAISYGVDEKTQRLDYQYIQDLALQHKPKLIIAGASAYSRRIDFQYFAQIAEKVQAVLLVDMAHIAGLVAAGLHPDPLPYADVVSSTTHKTLRGARGGLIVIGQDKPNRWGKKKGSKIATMGDLINSAIFPGTQGGPLLNMIAGKAVAFQQALKPSFKVYQQCVLDNMQALVHCFEEFGWDMVSGGSDNHLLVLDLTNLKITGKEAAQALDQAGITVNKNTIPYEQLSPFTCSGIRIGTPAITTRGFEPKDMSEIARWMKTVLENKDNETVLAQVKEQVKQVCQEKPLFAQKWLD